MEKRGTEKGREREAHFILGDVKSHGYGRGDAAFSTLEMQKERREDGKMRSRDKMRGKERESERERFF